MKKDKRSLSALPQPKRNIMISQKTIAVYAETGLFLREKRIAAGKSQEDVSKKLGYLSPQFISNWERGVCRPPHGTMKTIAVFYNCDPVEFCEQYIRILVSSFEGMIRHELDSPRNFRRIG